MQTLLFILNESPYGSEKTFNGLRLALNIKEEYGERVAINIFLMSDSVTAALANQQPAEGYNIEQMLDILLSQGSQLKLCKTCVDARGITELPLVEDAQIATLVELSQWTFAADKVLTF